MTDRIFPDVSEYQVPIDDTFNRQFVMFRSASEYDRPDKNYLTNIARALPMRASGKLINFGTYEIPGVVPNDALLGRLDAEGFPHDAVVMIDSERWGTLVTGDHSAQFNALAEALRKRQGGRAELVWGYSNRGDLSIWPNRPAWLGFMLAGYTNPMPTAPGLKVIGWQYCNAVENHTAYPSATAPFGRCDHNVLFIDYPLPNGDDVTPAQEAKLDRLLEQTATANSGLTVARQQHEYNLDAATSAQVNALIAQVAALQSAVGQLGAGGAIDYGKVQSAAAAALQSAHIVVGP